MLINYFTVLVFWPLQSGVSVTGIDRLLRTMMSDWRVCHIQHTVSLYECSQTDTHTRTHGQTWSENSVTANFTPFTWRI